MGAGAPSLVTTEWLKERCETMEMVDCTCASPGELSEANCMGKSHLHCSPCRLNDDDMRILDASWHMPNASALTLLRPFNPHACEPANPLMH